MQQKPVPVWHIITKMELGGAQEHTLCVVNGLSRSAYDTRLLTGKGGALYDEASYTLGSRLEVTPHLVRAPDLRRDALTLKWLVKRFKQAMAEHGTLIVHTHSSKAGILGRAAAAMAQVPWVFHTIHGYGFHQWQPFPVRRFYVHLERLAARATTHFVAVSNVDINTGIEESLFDAGGVTLIRSGFDLSAFKYNERAGKHLRRVLGIPPHVPVAGTVANFKAQKAPMDFIEAMIRVATEVPSAHFIYAGDGDLRPQAERRVREAGLATRFHFVGWRRDVTRIMSALNCYVLTSKWEGLPKTVPQAMTVGLPVVATCIGGTPEVVDHGRTGYLVKAGDIEGIANRTAHLLANLSKAQEMGALGREQVAEFDQSIMVEKHAQLYQRFLG